MNFNILRKLAFCCLFLTFSLATFNPVFSQDSIEPSAGELKESLRYEFLFTAAVGIGGLGALGYNGDLQNPAAGGGISFASELGVLFNYSLFAAELTGTLALLNKHNEKKVITENAYSLTSYLPSASGDSIRSIEPVSGSFVNIDLHFGAKFLTKKNRLGYTFAYIGPRFYITPKIKDNYTFSYTDPGTATLSRYSEEIHSSNTGAGWVIGIRDLTGWPIKRWTIIHQTGFYVSHAPVTSVSVLSDLNGVQSEQKIKNYTGFNIGFELGIGAALEPSGIGILLIYKQDFFRTLNNHDYGFGFSLSQIQIAGIKKLEL